MGFFGMVIKPGKKNLVEVPPGWCLQLCTAALEPPKGVKHEKTSATLWIQVEGEIGDTSFLLGTLQGGGACAQITVRHCLTSVDGKVVVEAKGAGSIHLTGFFDQEYSDDKDGSEDSEEEEDDEKIMPSSDAQTISKGDGKGGGMDEKNNNKKGKDVEEDDAKDSEDDDDAKDSEDDDDAKDSEDDSEDDDGEQVSVVKKGQRNIRSAAVAAAQAFASAKAVDPEKDEDDDSEDDEDYMPGEGGENDDDLGDEDDDEEEDDDDKEEDDDDKEENDDDDMGDEGKSGDGDEGGKAAKGGGDGENGASMGGKRGASDHSIEGASSPAAKKSKTKEDDVKEKAEGKSVAGASVSAKDSKTEGELTKLKRKRERKKQNKKKAAEAKRELEEAFSHVEKDDSPPVGVPLKGSRIKTLKGGLKVKDTVLGGGKIAVLGKNVKICYEGCFPDGRVFDKNMSRKKPLQFRLGMQKVIVGMDRGVEGMRVGGSREISIPAALGYGARGTGPIPANQDLVFRVELIDVGGK